MNILIIEFIGLVLFILFFEFILKINHSFILNHRISKYVIRNKENIDVAYLDRVINGYNQFVKKQRRRVTKLFPMLTRRYNKFCMGEDEVGADYVTDKIIISLGFTILTIISDILWQIDINSIGILGSLIVGFYLLDIGLWIRRWYQVKKIEKEMLQAIIIMNGAFKSGKSTIQAIELAANKLDKPINLEFKKMYQEMQYGLSIEAVFERFSKRVNIEEAEYLSSSLMILNRTGGNIVSVFNAIEKTLFDKMKLEEELKNSTAVSKLVVKILLIVPIVLIIFIYLLNPEYFNPFFASIDGYILLGISFILFIGYVYLLLRIVKVE